MRKTDIRIGSLGLTAAMMLFALCMTIVMTAFVSSARAADVTFSWDANTESDIAGYRLFQRQQGQTYDFGTSVWEGAGTTCTISFTEQQGTSYCWVLRAFDLANQESGNSNEVCWAAQDLPPADPQQLIIESVNLAQQLLDKLNLALGRIR